MLQLSRHCRIIDKCQPGVVPAQLLNSTEPLLLKGLLSHWPIVRLGQQGAAPLAADLQATMAPVQLTMSALILAFGLTQLVWGPVADRFGRLDVLIHNAGALTDDRRVSPQGIEMTVAAQVVGEVCRQNCFDRCQAIARGVATVQGGGCQIKPDPRCGIRIAGPVKSGAAVKPVSA